MSAVATLELSKAEKLAEIAQLREALKQDGIKTDLVGHPTLDSPEEDIEMALQILQLKKTTTEHNSATVRENLLKNALILTAESEEPEPEDPEAEEPEAGAEEPDSPSEFAKCRREITDSVIELCLPRKRDFIPRILLGVPVSGLDLDPILGKYYKTPNSFLRQCEGGQEGIAADLSQTKFPLHALILSGLGPAPRGCTVQLKDISPKRCSCEDNQLSNSQLFLKLKLPSLVSRLTVAHEMGLDPCFAFLSDSLHDVRLPPGTYRTVPIDAINLIGQKPATLRKLLGQLADWPHLLNRVEALNESVFHQEDAPSSIW
jgi:hypothetical protein